MNCGIAEDLIMKYFDGNINDVEKAQLKKHMAGCPECRNMYEELGAILDVVESGCDAGLPENFAEKVMEKVNTLESGKKEKISRWIILGFNAAMALCIVLVAIFGSDAYGIWSAPADGTAGGNAAVSLQGAFELVGHVFSEAALFVRNIINVLFQLNSMAMKMFYTVIIAAAAMFLAMQSAFTHISRVRGAGISDSIAGGTMVEQRAGRMEPVGMEPGKRAKR